MSAVPVWARRMLGMALIADLYRWASKCQFTIDTIQALKLVGWRVRQNYPSSIPVAIYCDESRVSGAGGLPGRRGAAEALGDAGSGSKSKVQGPKSKVQSPKSKVQSLKSRV